MRKKGERERKQRNGEREGRERGERHDQPGMTNGQGMAGGAARARRRFGPRWRRGGSDGDDVWVELVVVSGNLGW